MPDNIEKTKEIVSLLQQTTSLSIVSNFLKHKNVPHSAGSWEDMLEKRIIPLVSNNGISNNELVNLLSSVEEYGKQHVFLQKCKATSKAAQFMDRERVTAILREHNLEGLLSTPLILVQPAAPALVDVRWQTGSVDLNLTIKLVELRKAARLVETETDNVGRLHKIYAEEEHRVVHIAKLHRDGLLELRIASHANGSKYESEVRRVWHYFEPFFSSVDFIDISLSPAKLNMWTNRKNLEHLIRYTDATVRDEFGNLLRAVNGSGKTDLSSSKAVSGGLDYTLKNDKSSYCEGSNLWFKATNTLSTETHVLLSGQANEFGLPANCTGGDYQYVLDQLIYFNS